MDLHGSLHDDGDDADADADKSGVYDINNEEEKVSMDLHCSLK